MHKLLCNGFYLSPPFLWEDAHASHIFKGINYSIYLFINNYNVVSLSVENLEFDFDIFKERLKFIDEFKFIDNYSIEITFNPKSKFSTQKLFTLLSSEILLDENLNEYHFKYVVGIDYNERLLQKAINRGDYIWAASNPLDKTLLLKDIKDIPNISSADDIYKYFLNPKKYVDLTGFGKEVKTLIDNGYKFNAQTKMFIK